MAIKPPSDIVLDVVRAADPARQRAAVAKLTGAPATQPAHEFAELVGGTGPLDRFSTCGGPAAATGGDEAPDAFRSFEAFFIQNFLQSMLPKGAEATYGSGTAGEVWRSQLAEKMGDEIAKAGGIGIADRLLMEQAKSAGSIAVASDDQDALFSLSASLSRAAPFAGWESYLPFLGGQMAQAPALSTADPGRDGEAGAADDV